MSIMETIKKIFTQNDNLSEMPPKKEACSDNKILQVNDTIIVKDNVLCPDDEKLCIAGWQGKIIEIDNEDSEKSATIKWNADTLKQMPEYYIKQSVTEGLDFEVLTVNLNDVQYIVNKFDETERTKIADDLEKKFRWFSDGEEGERIQKVLENVDVDNDEEVYKKWNEYLKGKFTFPFKAKIAEYQENSKFRQDDEVIVKGIKTIDEDEGLIADIEHKKRAYKFPLCDLEVINDESPNYEPLYDYCYWFANR